MNYLLFLTVTILITAICADDLDQFFDVMTCDGGECVKLHLCPNGTLNTNGESLIDIRFDEDNSCEDYLLKCCPTDDIIEAPPKSTTTTVTPPISPPVTPPGTHTISPPTATPVYNQISTNPPPMEVQDCGIRNVDGIGFRITGNSDGESEYGEFPWMTAILKEEKALDQVLNVYQCGGSLITPFVVLTGAHCVQNKKAEQIKVRLGEWDTQTKQEMFDHQDRNVVDIVVHEDYYKGALHNDVALLFLDRPAELIESVQTICLPPQDYNFDNQRCFASGWGKDVFGKEGKYQVILKKIELPVVPFDKCQSALRTTRLGKAFKLHKSFICAGGEVGRDTCKGDGGSPLVCLIPGTHNQYYQAGLVAWGINCGQPNIPGVYANVAHFRNWIDAKIHEKLLPTKSYIPSL